MAENATALVTCTIRAPGVEAVTVTIARDVTSPALAEAVDDTSYSFAYTGKHDGGQLLPSRTDSLYGHVVDALIEAKSKIDGEMQKLLPAPAPTAPAAASPAAKVRVDARQLLFRVGLLACTPATLTSISTTYASPPGNILMRCRSRERMAIPRTGDVN